MLLGTTHDLAHLVVGRLVGIRFTHWFIDGPTRLQPGLKTDYASYLRTPPHARAWMHASGALIDQGDPVRHPGPAFRRPAVGATGPPRTRRRADPDGCLRSPATTPTGNASAEKWQSRPLWNAAAPDALARWLPTWAGNVDV